jgi:hypothetical protein
MALRQSLCVSMLVAASPALAADDFMEGVYLQSEDLCAQARKDSLQNLIEAGNMVLSAHGKALKIITSNSRSPTRHARQAGP